MGKVHCFQLPSWYLLWYPVILLLGDKGIEMWTASLVVKCWFYAVALAFYKATWMEALGFTTLIFSFSCRLPLQLTKWNSATCYEVSQFCKCLSKIFGVSPPGKLGPNNCLLLNDFCQLSNLIAYSFGTRLFEHRFEMALHSTKDPLDSTKILWMLIHRWLKRASFYPPSVNLQRLWCVQHIVALPSGCRWNAVP